MTTKVKIYQVGGSIRDELLGLSSKDIDYSVECDSFESMEQFILAEGGRIFLSKPEFLTIRAKVWNIDADFVLCRKESSYSDGRRPDKVEVGTIFDDLARRDFTVNAIAKCVKTGEYIDPHNGIKDLKNKVLRCVGNTKDRFNEDSLRILRAIRFSLTKELTISYEILSSFEDFETVQKLKNVSVDRIREELHRCFKHSTLNTLKIFANFPMISDIVFKENIIWLKPTSEEYK